MDDPRARLGTLVKRRRQGLGLTMTRAAAAAGIDRNTWSNVEGGKRQTSDSNYAGIERALRWTPGSIATVLAGGDPALADRRAPTGDLDLDARTVAEIERIKSLPMNTENKLKLIRVVLDMYIGDQERRAAQQDDPPGDQMEAS